MDPKNPIDRLEQERWLEREKKDLEVEHDRGPRPLEGFAGGETSWTQAQDDRPAEMVHGHDERESERRSEEQIHEAERTGQKT